MAIFPTAPWYPDGTDMPWTKWFAWFPVRTEAGRYVWLRWIEWRLSPDGPPPNDVAVCQFRLSR